jgi:hypothetical protein
MDSALYGRSRAPPLVMGHILLGGTECRWSISSFCILGFVMIQLIESYGDGTALVRTDHLYFVQAFDGDILGELVDESEAKSIARSCERSGSGKANICDYLSVFKRLSSKMATWTSAAACLLT